MNIEIKNYDNILHRSQVVKLWKDIFGYTEARNDPELSIDKKLAVDKDLFFVAVDSGKVIGTIMAGYDGHRGWIYSLAVMPENRKTNIGTKLLETAEKKLKEKGCLKINLQIMSTNIDVMKFYKKNGYKKEERISMGKALE